MSEMTQEAARLLEIAQSGGAAAALARASAFLTLPDGPACMHFVRAIALTNLGEPHASLEAVSYTHLTLPTILRV